MNQPKLFEFVDRGAQFSECGKYRYALWRIWDRTKPLVMFIGLNPSTANETEADKTIESVIRISRFNGYGGFYMMNLWPYIATKPELLKIDARSSANNYYGICETAKECQDVVFAWGNFKIVKDKKRDLELFNMFQNAKCIGQNKNGSPKHPLYQREQTTIINYRYGV